MAQRRNDHPHPQRILPLRPDPHRLRRRGECADVAIYRRQRQPRRLLFLRHLRFGRLVPGGAYHDAYAIPLGNFEPGYGFVPDYSVYEDRMEPWVSITGEAIEHHD